MPCCCPPCTNLCCVLRQLPSVPIDSLLEVVLHCIGGKLGPCPLCRLQSRRELDLFTVLHNCTEKLLLDDLVVRHVERRELRFGIDE